MSILNDGGIFLADLPQVHEHRGTWDQNSVVVSSYALSNGCKYIQTESLNDSYCMFLFFYDPFPLSLVLAVVLKHVCERSQCFLANVRGRNSALPVRNTRKLRRSASIRFSSLTIGKVDRSVEVSVEVVLHFWETPNFGC